MNTRHTLPPAVSFYTIDAMDSLIGQVSAIGFVSATVTDEDPEQVRIE